MHDFIFSQHTEDAADDAINFYRTNHILYIHWTLLPVHNNTALCYVTIYTTDTLGLSAVKTPQGRARKSGMSLLKFGVPTPAEHVNHNGIRNDGNGLPVTGSHPTALCYNCQSDQMNSGLSKLLTR